MVIVWFAQPLLPVKVKPPTAPLLTLVSVTDGRLPFVKVQAITFPGAVANALSVMVPNARFGVAVPPPMPEQLAAVST